MTPASTIHKDSIIIDNACPMAVKDEFHAAFINGGFTAVAATVGYGMAGIGTLDFTMKTIGKWLQMFRESDGKLLHITETNDVYKAKKERKLGIIFHFQGTTPFEDDINTVELFYRLGVRMVQLCYNEKDLVGCGSAVENDSGLTEFGGRLIQEFNRLGIVIDCAHTGFKTTMDAIAASKSPVIISHGNAKAVCANRRNYQDDLIRAIGENGGVIGFNGFPGFVAPKPRPTLNDLLDHVDHMVNVAGPEHVCVGMDYFEYQAGAVDDDTATQVYDFLIDSGSWNTSDYPAPPWHYPIGIEMPDKFEYLTSGLSDRGYSESEIKGILGLNVMRIFDMVWR